MSTSHNMSQRVEVIQDSRSLEKPQATKPAEQRSFEDSLPEWVKAGKPDSRDLLLLWWWLYARLGAYKLPWIPQPRSITSYKKAILALEADMVEHRQQSRSIITVHTIKGGATKTTVSTWLAAFLASIHHKEVALLDTDRGGGKAVKRFGLTPREAPTTNELAVKVKRGDTLTHGDMIANAASDPVTGVTIYHSISGNSIGNENMVGVIKMIHDNSHTVVVDTGPGLRVPATLASVQTATVPVIVGNGNSKDDLDDIEDTLGFENYGLRGRIDSVLIVISALPKRRCTTKEQHAFAQRYKVRPDQVILIPFNRYLQQTGNVLLSKLDPATAYGFTRLAHHAAAIAVGVNTQSKGARHELRVDDGPSGR